LTNAIQFAVLGLGVGAIYALLAQGLVVLYGGTGVLNFAHGAVAMFTAYMYRQVHDIGGWPLLPSFVVCIGAAAGFGVAVHYCVMRPLLHASSIARVVATLGILATLEGLASLIWGPRPTIIDPIFPSRVFTVHRVVVPVDRVWLLAIATGVTIVLWAAYRFTAAGLAVRASSQYPRGAAALGWSPDLAASGSWAISCGLAGSPGS